MPKLSCRDWDEVCDWERSEADPLRLLVVNMTHLEAQHAKHIAHVVETSLAGVKPLSRFYEEVISFMRWP